ncbi:MAG TPA: heme exporter protein CcmB [Spirochaetota bacterium]|nr:heme exporter protein CcmB [Spirochaetota bacterium]
MGNDVLRNLRKDFLVEFRSRFALNVSASFAAIVTIAISLTAGGVPFSPKVQAIVLWIVIFFSAMNGLSHIFVREEDQGTALFLRTAVNVDSVFVSKFIFNQAFMAVILAVVTPLYLFFLQVQVLHVAHFIFSVAAGGVSIAAATTILAAMVAKAGGKGSLFTIISFPILLPVLWISISSTSAALNAPSPTGGNLLFLLAFSGFISVISFLLFRFVWLED